jgi:hypothetical protein
VTEQAIPAAQTATDTPGRIIEAARWLASLSASQIMTLFCVSLFVAGCYSIYYTVSHVVPVHLNTVQQGYEELADRYLQDAKEKELRYDERFKRLSDQWDAAAKRNEETNAAIRDLVRELLFQRRAGGAILPPAGGET